MKTFGPLYVDNIKYYHKNIFPIIERGWTRETEYPYRSGKCLVLRFPKTIPGLVLGVWTDTPNISPDNDDAIDDLLKVALRADDQKYGVEDIKDWDV